MPQAADAMTVDWSDVQGEIFQPYAHDFSAHLLIGFPTPDAGRAFVSAMRPRLSTADRWHDEVPSNRNLGLSFSGLTLLGLSGDILDSFPYPFRLGMAARAAVLGDNAGNAPANWQAPYGDLGVHAWAMVTGVSAVERDSALAEVRALAEGSGAHILHEESADNFPGKGQRTKEHFGFNDGIGQPAVECAPGPSWPGQGTPEPDGGWKPLALGEFLLGYPNELGDAVPHPANPALRLNGTYMAYRKLEQDVPLFRDYIEKNKHLTGGNGDLLAAKMVGRWRSGAPLELSPDHDDPGLGSDDARNDDFRYADDVEGLRVPHLSHIRRANPRDSLSKDSAVQPRLHRIIRRKMPYGSFMPEGAAADHAPRGIIFRVFNADIVAQFELVQSQWMGSGNEVGGLSTDQDVFAGLTDPTGTGPNCLGSTLPIPCAHGLKTLYGLPKFVTLKGGEYFFVPGLKALDWIVAHSAAAQGDTP